MKENVYIIIHGFGGGLYEIEYLAHYLRSKGLDVHTVLLAGHGSTKKNLKKHSYLDWIHSVNITVSKLKRDYKYIHMIGFSMGGLIITHFTAMFEINKIVFINTPIYFWNIRIILRDVINGILSRKYERINFYKKSITGTSLKTNIDFLRLLSVSKKLFVYRDKPTLIIQCMGDESTHYKSARYIKDKIGTNAILQYYNGGCHLVFSEFFEERDVVCADIYSFLVSTGRKLNLEE